MSTIVTPLKQKYNNEIKKQLQTDLGISNVMAVPRLDKIVINVGLGRAKDDASWLGEMEELLAQITGQKPARTKSTKAISNFKLREGMEVGLKVTLRRDKMWFFLDKFINIVLPRTKDFRGISRRSFDGKGNYSIGLKDQTVFPEVDTTKNIRLHGLQISIITTAESNEAGILLLEKLGMPFKKA